MDVDARVRAALTQVLEMPIPPPASLSRIAQRVSLAPPKSIGLRLAFAACAAGTLGVLVLPAISPALTASFEARARAALVALGGIAPNAAPVPPRIFDSTKLHVETFASAQRLVSFPIVVPSGIPVDARPRSIEASRPGVYSKLSHSWGTGPYEVTFLYVRANARSFFLTASRYDPSDPPSKYIFTVNDESDPAAKPVLVRHDMVAWRNGDQEMVGVAGNDISVTELRAIRDAMRGVAVAQRGLHVPRSGNTETMRRIPAP